MLAYEKIDLMFSKNRTGSFTFVPKNSGSEKRAVRRSLYEMSVEYSKVFVGLCFRVVLSTIGSIPRDVFAVRKNG